MKSPVAPLVGAWIEIDMALISWRHSVVAPLVGAWIEMHLHQQGRCKAESLPLWERGLKSYLASAQLIQQHVAPLVGAWIEISFLCAYFPSSSVAPLVGAWIEITSRCLLHATHPRRSPCGSVD